MHSDFISRFLQSNCTLLFFWELHIQLHHVVPVVPLCFMFLFSLQSNHIFNSHLLSFFFHSFTITPTLDSSHEHYTWSIHLKTLITNYHHYYSHNITNLSLSLSSIFPFPFFLHNTKSSVLLPQTHNKCTNEGMEKQEKNNETIR